MGSGFSACGATSSFFGEPITIVLADDVRASNLFFFPGDASSSVHEVGGGGTVLPAGGGGAGVMVKHPTTPTLSSNAAIRLINVKYLQTNNKQIEF